jgi:GT2 family glycosyltransferase
VEDRQWCWTIRQLGYKVLYYPEAKIIHLISGSSGMAAEKKWKEVVLPNEYLYFKGTRSNLYALFFYLTAALVQLLSIQRGTKKQAIFFFRFAVSNFLK